MRINEIISEAGPAGTTGVGATVSAWKGAAKSKLGDLSSRAGEKMFGTEKERIAKQNRKKWYAIVKQKLEQNINMKDENTYRNELYKYLGGNGRLKLSRDLKKMVGQLPMTDQTILKIMTKTIDDRIAAKQKLANAPKLGGQQTTAGPTP